MISLKSLPRNYQEILVFLFILILAILYLIFLLTGLELNSDEANWGLMAKHISEGRHFPIFSYSLSYLGTLEAYLAALSFTLFGIGPIQLRLSPGLLSIGFLILFYLMVKRLYGKNVALWSLAIAATPNFTFAVWLVYCNGGHPSTLLFICLGVILLISILEQKSQISIWRWGILGCVAGFSLYIHYLILPFWITAGLGLILKERRKMLSLKYLLPLGIGFLIGFSPALYFYLSQFSDPIEFKPFRVAYPREGLFGYGKHILIFFSQSIPKMTGVKIDFPNIAYSWYTIGFTVLFYLFAVLYYSYDVLFYAKNIDPAQIWGRRIIPVFALFHITAYMASAIGSEYVSRYLIPLLIPLSIASGVGLNRLAKQKFYFALIPFCILVGVNFYGCILGCSFPQAFFPITIFPQQGIEEITEFCEKENISHLYTDFHIAALFNFYNQEKRIASGALGPVHLDYYPPYREAVAADLKAAYVVLHSPNMGYVELFEWNMAKLEIHYRLKRTSFANIYYDFSRSFKIEELDLPS